MGKPLNGSTKSRKALIVSTSTITMLLLVAGCATETPVPEYKSLTERFSKEKLQQALQSRPEIKKPWRVAIVRVSKGGALGGFVTHGNTPQESIDMWTALAKKCNGVADAEFLPEILIPPGYQISYDLLRLGAAKRQCNLLLIVREQRRKVQISNAWAVGYFTIIGAFFIPGTDCIVDAKFEAMLADPVSGHIFGDIIVSGRGYSYGPLYFVNTWRARAAQRATKACRKQAANALPKVFENVDKPR